MSKLDLQLNKKSIAQDGVFAVAMLAAAVFLFWKCRYGFGNIDESFYITIPYRLFRGDALFLEEWHLSQMAGLLTLPPVALYVSLTGGTDGIILFMRYLCSTVQCAIALFIYLRLRKITWAGAAVAALSFVLYIPFGIMALSYNSMGIMALVVCTVILYTAKSRKPLQYIIAGLFYAVAVLCCPYLAVVFVLYLVAVGAVALGKYLSRTPAREDFDCWSIKGAFFVSVGAAIAAVAFLAFVLSRASVGDILKAFPQILNDPEHPAIAFVDSFNAFFRRIDKANALTPQLYDGFLLLGIVCIADRNSHKRKLAYFPIATALTIVLMHSHYELNNYINTLMWSVNVLAIFAFILTQDKRIKGMFYTMWIPGILYAFCLNITSNQGFYAISSASAAATVGSILMVTLFAAEMVKDSNVPIPLMRYCAAGLVGLLMVFQLGTQCVLRYNSVFWEKGMENQTVRIEDGIDAGLIVSEAWDRSYHNTLKNLQVLEKYDPEKVLFLSKSTWYYLATDYESSTYSAWIAGVTEHSINRLEAYYALNPHKMPDAVFADIQYKEIAQLFCQRFDYQMESVPGGYVLTK